MGERELEAVRAAIRDCRVLIGRLEGIESELSGESRRPCRITELTEREAEVALRVCDGTPLDVLSSELGISVNTTRNHIRAVYRKLDIHSRTQLCCVMRLANG